MTSTGGSSLCCGGDSITTTLVNLTTTMVDLEPAAGVSPPLHIVRTMDNMQVDHGIETMIEETNLDEHGRMKTQLFPTRQRRMSSGYFVKLFVLARKLKKIHGQSRQGGGLHDLRCFQGAEEERAAPARDFTNV